MEISWDCVIFDISSLTRWLIGALDPTHGHAVDTAEAGAAEQAIRPPAARTSAKPAKRALSSQRRKCFLTDASWRCLP
jgi:hypothetical protein